MSDEIEGGPNEDEDDLVVRFHRAMRDATAAALEEGTDLLTPAERAALEALVQDPKATISYELLRGILCWSDEAPVDDGTGVTFWKIVMLQSYRSMMWRLEHHQQPAHLRDWFMTCRAAWEKAHASGLRWIGFPPSRTDPANLALLLEFEEAEFGGM